MTKKTAAILGSVGAAMALSGFALIFLRRALIVAAAEKDAENERLLERADMLEASLNDSKPIRRKSRPRVKAQ